jgi:hypothetical protein
MPDGTIQIWDAAAGYEFARSNEFAVMHFSHLIDLAAKHWQAGHTDEARELFMKTLRDNRSSFDPLRLAP